MAKTAVQPIDLDDIEQQLREVAGNRLRRSPAGNAPPRNGSPGGPGFAGPARAAAPASPVPSESSDDALAELARKVGRESFSGVARRAGPPSFLDHRLSVRTEPVSAGQADAASPPATGQLPEAELVADMPYAMRASRLASGRSSLSPRALAVAIPCLIVVGIGAAVAMRMAPAGWLEGKSAASGPGGSPARPEAAIGGGPAASPAAPGTGAKPRKIELTRSEQPAEGGAPPAPAREPAAVAQPAAAPAGAAAAPQPEPAAAPAPVVALREPPAVPGSIPNPAAAPKTDPPQAAVLSSVFGVPRRVATLSVRPDGNLAPGIEPAAAAPQAAHSAPSNPPLAAVQASLFGAPRRVATLSVKPDGSLAPGVKPDAGAAPATHAAPAQPSQAMLTGGTPRRVATVPVKPDGRTGPGAKTDTGASAGPAPTKLASVVAAKAPDAAKPAAASTRKHADKVHAKPATANHRRARRAAKPLVLQTIARKGEQQSSASAPANPLTSVAGLFRKALETAHIVKPTAEP